MLRRELVVIEGCNRIWLLITEIVEVTEVR